MVKLFPSNARTEFVDLVCGGMSVDRAARRVGASSGTGTTWWSQSGQMRVNMGREGGLADPVPSLEGPGRTLSLAERAKGFPVEMKLPVYKDHGYGNQSKRNDRDPHQFVPLALFLF